VNPVRALMHITLLRAQALQMEKIIENERCSVELRKRAESLYNRSIDMAQRIENGQKADSASN